MVIEMTKWTIGKAMTIASMLILATAWTLYGVGVYVDEPKYDCYDYTTYDGQNRTQCNSAPFGLMLNATFIILSVAFVAMCFQMTRGDKA